MDSLTFWLNLSLVAPRGRVDGLFPFGGNTRYANTAPINGGKSLTFFRLVQNL